MATSTMANPNAKATVTITTDTSKIAVRNWGKITARIVNGLLIIIGHGVYALNPIANETVVATVSGVSNVEAASVAAKVDGQDDPGIAMFAGNTLRMINVHNADKAIYFTIVVPLL